MNSFKTMEHSNQDHIPLYLKVCDWLRKYMDDPEVVKAGKLPPESELAKQLGISRKTLRHSLDILAKDGLIKRVKNRGTILTSRMSSSDPRKVKCVGMVFPITSAWDNLVSLVKNKFAIRGYNFRMYLYEQNDLEDEKKAFELARKECAGLLIHPCLDLKDEDMINELAKERFPIVLFGSTFDNLMCNIVALDGYRLAYHLTKAMLDEGRRRIVYLSQEIYREWPPEIQKINGYRKAMEATEIGFDEKMVVFANYSGENITEAVNRLNPDGIVISNAYFSFVLISELLKQGKQIPGDVRLGRFRTPEDLPHYKDSMFVVSSQDEIFSENLVSVLCDSINDPSLPFQRVYVGADIIVNE